MESLQYIAVFLSLVVSLFTISKIIRNKIKKRIESEKQAEKEYISKKTFSITDKKNYYYQRSLDPNLTHTQREYAKQRLSELKN